jgi:hypothetical protein
VTVTVPYKLVGGQDAAPPVISIRPTMIHCSFRLISREESAHHDIDLPTLVRRSWFGELKRNSSGAPQSARFRFPLLCTVVRSNGGTFSTEEEAQRDHVEKRLHSTVVCVVQRSGHVTLRTTSHVEDAAAIALYVHRQLKPHVFAPGAGAELEHSIASSVPEDVTLVHFGAIISIPVSWLSSTSNEVWKRRALGLPLRKLRDMCLQWPSSSSAAGDDVSTKQPDGLKQKSARERPSTKRPRDAEDDDAALCLTSSHPKPAPLHVHLGKTTRKTDKDDTMLLSLFQQQSTVMSMMMSADMFHFPASAVPNMWYNQRNDASSPLPCAPSRDKGHDVAYDATNVLGANAEHPVDLPPLGVLHTRCHLVVLPCREDHRELRIEIVPTRPHHSSSCTDLGCVPPPLPPSVVTRSSRLDTVVLSLMHTGTVRVVRASSFGLVVWVVEHVLAPLLIHTIPCPS